MPWVTLPCSRQSKALPWRRKAKGAIKEDYPMPIINVELLAGRDAPVLQKLAQGLTQEAASALGIPAQRVRVILREVPASRWFVGGNALNHTRN